MQSQGSRSKITEVARFTGRQRYILGRILPALSGHLAQNLIYNYGVIAWLGFVTIISAPLYLRLLGPAEWGIVAACMTVQGFLALLDIGFSQITTRSFAAAHSEPRRLRSIFQLYSRVFLVLSLVGFTAAQLSISVFVEHWLQPAAGMDSRVEWALRLVAFQFLFQLANNANIAYWMGRDMQRLASVRQCIFTTLRHGGALIAVTLISKTVFAYLASFLIFTLVEWALNARRISKELDGRGLPAETVPMRKVVAELRAGVSLTAAIMLGMLGTQLDRLFLSKSLSLSDYGLYIIVANFGLAFMNLQHPIMRSFFPRIVRESQQPKRWSLTEVYLLSAVMLLCIVPCIVVIITAPRVLLLLVGDPQRVAATVWTLKLLLMAVSINALYNIIYQKMIALNCHKEVLIINCLAILASGVTVVFGSSMGISLGGAIWLTGTTTQLLAGMVWYATATGLTARVSSMRAIDQRAQG